MKTETKNTNEIEPTENEVREDWPLWLATLAELRKLPEFGYGMEIPVSWFESKLSCKFGTIDYSMDFMRLREMVEIDDGYSLQQRTVRDEHGDDVRVVLIPSGDGHGDVARGWECKMRNYARRAFAIREKTLNNPESNLSAEERSRMERQSEIAATRLILLRREVKIGEILMKYAPKILKKDKAKDDEEMNEEDGEE